MLNIKNVSIKVANKEILHDLNLKINEGEIHVLMGPNGIGKSSICKTIMKAPGYEVTSGTITYNNQNLQELTTDTIAKLGIMFIMQNPTAVEGVTNAELLRTALSTKNNEHVDIFKFNKEMENICQKINLPKSFIHRNVNEGMSGGNPPLCLMCHVVMNAVVDVESHITVAFEYPYLNQIMRIVKEDGPTIISQQFDMDCVMTLRIRKGEAERLRNRLQKVETAYLKEDE